MERFQLALESLETRWVPATTVTIKEFTILVIKGDDAANTVVVDDQGNGDVKIAVDGGAATDYTNVTKLIVRLGLGDDAVSYTLATSPTRSLKLNVDTGDGNDTTTFAITADMTHPDRARRFDLLAGTGDDSVTANFMGLADARLFLGATLGAGNDTLDLTLGGSLTGISTAGFTVLGQTGADTMHFNALGVNVSNRSVLGVTAFGGADDDTFTSTYQGKLNGLTALVFQGSLGNDTINSLVTLDDGSQGTFGGGVTGDLGNDVLTFKITNNNADIAEVIAILYGGKGQDQGLASGNIVTRGIESGIPVGP